MSKTLAVCRFVGTIAACAVIGGGCATGEKNRSANVGQPQTPRPGESIIASMRRGIEVHRLLDRPFRHKLEPILSQFSADPLGLSARQIEMWRGEGLRIVAVPADEKSLQDLVLALTQEPLVERVRMGVVPEWRAVAIAPKIDGSKLVRVGGEIGAFGDGRFRLLMRDYPLIGVPTPVLRLELVVQFHQPRRDPFAPDAAKEERMGMYIPTSALSMDLDGNWAVVVTAADPAANWDDQPPAQANATDAPAQDAGGGDTNAHETPRTAGGDAGEANDPPPPQRQAPPQGPESPRILTTGEETLLSPDGETRLVLIFVPRLK